jgi:hypothetical protein
MSVPVRRWVACATRDVVRAGTTRGAASCPACRGASLGVAQGTLGRAEHSRGRGSTADSPRGRTPEGYVGDACRAGDVASETRVRRCRRSAPNLIQVHLFKNAKLQKVATTLKIPKNRSCRGYIDLQLLQRASYVLINRFVRKSC